MRYLIASLMMFGCVAGFAQDAADEVVVNDEEVPGINQGCGCGKGKGGKGG